MASQKEPLEPSVRAKNLIQSFEKGEVKQGSEVNKEKPVSRPGATKKLMKEYEQKGRQTDDIAAQGVNGVPKRVLKKMKVFIVFAHCERKSFNGALLDSAVEALTSQGHTVEVSDLYDMKWNPCTSRDDFKGKLKNPDSFSWTSEAAEAVKNGTLSPDITAEHAKIMAADLVIFQFPMNWYGFPAMLKGYIDRVWTPGFAFASKQGEFFDKATFKGKKAILSFTTGTPESFYQTNGFNGDINIHLWPLNNTLRFVGFDVLPPNIVFSPGLSTDEQRKQALASWAERTKTLAAEKPLKFLSVDSFNLAAGGYLDYKFVDEQVLPNDQFGLTIGQNLGKKLPVNSMLSSEGSSDQEKAAANGV